MVLYLTLFLIGQLACVDVLEEGRGEPIGIPSRPFSALRL